MKLARRPIVYEINTAVFLNGLSKKYKQPITLANIPDDVWDKLASLGVDAVWLMGVWQRSPLGAKISLKDKVIYEKAVSGLLETDVIGSAYCIQDYVVDGRWGGPEALVAARQKLASRNIGLILDFVPNHVAPDHPWVKNNPEYFIQGSSKDQKHHPDSFYIADEIIVANGKDPNYPPWTDVVQLNAFSAGYREASADTLKGISEQCDGVRCDMAMLMLNDVFSKTWKGRAGSAPPDEYWQQLIEAIRRTSPDFLFIAEVYWDLHGSLIELGFDYCYDKTFYDLLRKKGVRALIRHLNDPAQEKMLRFIENHDEPRSARAFGPEKLRAAAVLLSTVEGAKLYLDGQFAGYKIRIPVQLARGPEEAADEELSDFYQRLVKAVNTHIPPGGKWTLLHAKTRYLGLPSGKITAWLWEGEKRLLVLVNYSPHSSRVKIPFKDVGLKPSIEVVFQSPSPVELKQDGQSISAHISPWGYCLAQL